MRLRSLSQANILEGDALLLEEQTAVVQKQALYEDIVKSGFALRVRVTGRSMRPFLKGGEVLTIRAAHCNSLRKGDIVLFRSPQGRPVLHRIVGKKKGCNGMTWVQTKGDAMTILDEPVQVKDILGKVVLIEKCSGTFNNEGTIMRAINYLAAVLSLLGLRVRRTLKAPRKVVR